LLETSQLDPQTAGTAQIEALNQAFSSFAATARSLEDSYGRLQAEVRRLRLELEERNGELRSQLAENRRIRESLHRLFEGLPCGVVVAGRNAQVVSANPAARQMLRLRDTRDLPVCFSAVLAEVRSSPGGVAEYLDAADSETQEARWLRIHWGTLDSELEQQVVFTIFDVTEAREREKQRESHARQLALARMAVLLAHEVRNPLGSLELFAGLLSESDLTAEQCAWVEHIQTGLRLLASTVNNVLQFHSQPRPSLAPTDLGRMLEWVADFLRPIARRAGVELRIENRLREFKLLADGPRLEQVLLNLGLNALQAMPNGGCLTFGGRPAAEGTRNRVAITVCDTGPGIDESMRARIFEPGFSSREGSSGLGLTVCQTIVEQHGGTIEVGRSGGVGASFVIQLPVKESA
jgi:signal transduction histidine kinase